MPFDNSEHRSDRPALGLHWRYGLGIVLCVLGAVAWRAVYLAADYGKWETLVDFHAFYISGKLFHEGLINNAYKLSTMMEAQRAFAGSTSFMPWTYPPPFNMIVALLAMAPFVLAYIMFTAGTFSVYAAVLYRLSPETFSFAIWLALPASVVMVICGQNGFLTAAIVGLFCHLYLKSSFWAGAALGLMIIKPHLGIGIGLWLLFRREFTPLVLAGAVACVLCGLATLIMGPSVWQAFLDATAEASAFLKQGHYPLYRMTSIYAGLRSSGAPAELAMLIHLAVAACAIGVIFLAARNIADLRTGLGVAIFATFFISPYLYDYDLPMLAVAFTLLYPTLSRAVQNQTMVGLVALAWVAGACGLLSFLPYWAMGELNPKAVAQGWAPMLAMAAVILVRIRVTAGYGNTRKPA